MLTIFVLVISKVNEFGFWSLNTVYLINNETHNKQLGILLFFLSSMTTVLKELQHQVLFRCFTNSLRHFLTFFYIMSDRVCGCNVVTAAGITTSLQMVVLLLALSSTGMVLDRFRLWRAVGSGTVVTTIAPANSSIQTEASIWSDAWLELAMAWYVAFASFWLFTLFIVCLSFKYYRPVFVVPNFIALVVGIFMNAFGFGK